MSCNFNPINCKNCPKYNACLLQVIYANTLTLATMIDNINNRLEMISNQPVTTNDTSNVLNEKIDIVDNKLNELIRSYNSYEYVPIIEESDEIIEEKE